MKSDEVAYANDSIIFQHQQQQGMMYSAGGDLSDAPLPPLPTSGPHNNQQQQQQSDPIQSDRYYSSQQRHSRHSLGLDSEF